MTDDTRLPRSFLTLWAGQTASLFGTEVAGFGIAILVFLQTGSLWWLTALFLAARVPALLVSSHAGALADRVSRRQLLIGADVAAGVASLAALVLHLTGNLRPGHLVVLAVVGSLANAYQRPAYEAALPKLVGTEALPRAHGLLQLSPALALLAAPAAGGVLVASVGLVAVLVVDLLTFAVAVGATLMISIPDPDGADRTRDDRPSGSLLATWRHLDGPLRGVRRLIAWTALLTVATTAVNLLLPPLLLSVTAETMTGFVVGLGGAAMVGGSAVVAARGIPQQRVVALAVAIGVLGAGVVLLGLRPSLVSVVAGVVVTLAAAPVGGAVIGTIHQTSVEPEWHGRLAALRRVVAESLLVPTAILLTPIVERWAEPAMVDGGSLADTLGTVLGTGPGRGVGLVFVIAGLALVAAAVAISRDRSIGLLDGAPRTKEPLPV